jgi:hypothetical protein
MSTRASVQDDWGAPVNMGGIVNSGSFDHSPILSADELALIFTSNRPSGFGGFDLWMTTRKTHSDPWSPPVNLGPGINSWGHEDAASISVDARTLYFLAHTPPGGLGGYDMWEAPIIPIVDFNGDEIVNIQDLLRLIEHWGQNYPLCDIGPMPWGDGKIDAADLEVLMRCWQQEILDPALAAYWKLDAAEGSIAQNSVSDNHGTLHDEPLWQPAGGKKAGALQFDGINDYIGTDFVLNPADGPFSVFAWVKGGAPGQVILSQATGADWLMASSPGGALMTDLRLPGRHGQSLTSSVLITDGAWHRVGFVWDGSKRILYVDDVEVAKDTQTSMVGVGTGLYIGAGSNLATGSFWSGLIDDVRIYNSVVHP